MYITQMLIYSSLFAFIAPKCIPNVTVWEDEKCRSVYLTVYPTCVSPPYQDCSLLELAWHATQLQQQHQQSNNDICIIGISTCGDREFMLKSLIDILLERKYQDIINGSFLTIKSLYDDFNVSRSVFDIFWGRRSSTYFYQIDLKQRLKTRLYLWNGLIFDDYKKDFYSTYHSDIPVLGGFNDECVFNDISEFKKQNMTDLLIIRSPGWNITQILTYLIGNKTCFKVYNNTDRTLNESLIGKLKTNLVLYADSYFLPSDVFKVILQQNKTIIQYLRCNKAWLNYQQNTIMNVTRQQDAKLYTFANNLNARNKSNFWHYVDRFIRFYLSGNVYKIRRRGETYFSLKHIPAKPREYQCVVPSCLEGYEPVYGQQKLSNWDQEFGWVSCKKCEKVSLKTLLGHTFCACPKGTIPRNNFSECYYVCEDNTEVVNMSGSKCFQPWKQQWLVEVSLVLSLIGLLLVIFVVVTFNKHKKTPIVLSFNRKITVLQLTYHIMLFLEPLLLLLAPSEVLCGVHIVLVGHMVTMLMSVIVARSQVRIYIFRHKGKMLSKDIFMLKSIEMFTILTINCLYVMLAVLLITSKDVIEGDFIEDLKITNSVCSTLHTQVQQCFFIVLAVVCCVQAYRTRSLPSVYKEITLILTAMCFTSVLVGISFASSFSGKEDKRHLFRVLFTYMINFILLIVIFGINVYWILFRSDINSKENFQLSMLRNVKKGSSLQEDPLSSAVIVK